MANVAVINGSSRYATAFRPCTLRSPGSSDFLTSVHCRGLGLHFARYLLSRTDLQVVATSSRQSDKAREAILSGASLPDGGEERLTTLDLDVTDERTIERAASDVEERFGKGNLRLLINVAGIVSCLAYRRVVAGGTL